MSDPVALWKHDHDVWQLATPLQLLRLLKLFNVEGRTIAEQLGVHPPAISMWLHGKRPIPDRYRPALVAWAQQARGQAHEQLAIDLKAQPTDALREAMLEAFFAPLRQWSLEVLYEGGTFARSIQRECQWIGTYATKEELTEADYEGIETLCHTILSKVQTVRALQQEQAVGEGEAETRVEGSA